MKLTYENLVRAAFFISAVTWPFAVNEALLLGIIQHITEHCGSIIHRFAISYNLLIKLNRHSSNLEINTWYSIHAIDKVVLETHLKILVIMP